VIVKRSLSGLCCLQRYICCLHYITLNKYMESSGNVHTGRVTVRGADVSTTRRFDDRRFDDKPLIDRRFADALWDVSTTTLGPLCRGYLPVQHCLAGSSHPIGWRRGLLVSGVFCVSALVPRRLVQRPIYPNAPLLCSPPLDERYEETSLLKADSAPAERCDQVQGQQVTTTST